MSPAHFAIYIFSLLFQSLQFSQQPEDGGKNPPVSFKRGLTSVVIVRIIKKGGKKHCFLLLHAVV